MANIIETAESAVLGIAVVKGTCVFPVMSTAIELYDELSSFACESAFKSGDMVFFVAAKNTANEKFKTSDLYRIGTVCKIKHFEKQRRGIARVVVEGVCRATVSAYNFSAELNRARIIFKTLRFDSMSDAKVQALLANTKHRFAEFAAVAPNVSKELMDAAKSIEDPGLLSDLVASSAFLTLEDKQAVLEKYDPIERLELLNVLLESEKELIKLENDIQKTVRERIDAGQRDYFLREQIKYIKEMLGDGEDIDDVAEYIEKIKALKASDEAKEHLIREANRLAKMPFASTESALYRNYLDVCLEVPFGKYSKERLSIPAAEKILEKDHDGMKEIKERMLEYLAVRKLTKSQGTQIICLVGPPGVGKTSIAYSVARALGLVCRRVSLGGIRDEADIRGHRKTYVGAIPGRIIDAITRAKVMNPLIILDEIDKMTDDSRGDPISAMLEVLDPTQNTSFRDHFLEIPVDLSDCLFIATANNISKIPRALIDRMEIIELPSYTENEKFKIAKNHLVSRALKHNGLKPSQIKFTKDAILEIINGYTHEAGVRELERKLTALCRKIARKIESGEIEKMTVSKKDVGDILGARLIPEDAHDLSAEIGVVNGLAYTEVGGDVLKIETLSLGGSGKIKLTGSLGDVMKESAETAITYIRSISDVIGIDYDFAKTKDLHIHVPEGATPKDGPSAGVTLCVSVASELSKKPARGDIAMTGEITLHGKILPIGGLREKTMAAYRYGIRNVIIPKGNIPDLEKIDGDIADKMKFYPCETVLEALALCGIINGYKLPKEYVCKKKKEQ
ncbi:MAG: endopeptidase La [Clostridia bacterium]|nr:endopeptidase La [Clostridia bacterium]